MASSKIRLPELILLIAGFGGLVAAQCNFQSAPGGDEHDYLLNVPLLHQYGFGTQYLRHLVGSAGPLYSVVQFCFEPLTHLHTPAIRWVNAAFLLGVVWLLDRILRVMLPETPALFGWYLLSLPIMYVVAGLALTEMPAMFFFCAALYFVMNAGRQTGTKKLLLVMVAGLCMSLSIAGRQPYLLTLIAWPILFLFPKPARGNSMMLLMFLLASLMLPCYIFFTWGGLVPTIEAKLYSDIADSGVHYKPAFFILCVFYLAACMLLLAPSFFKLHFPKKTLITTVSVAVLIIIGNVFFHWMELLPVKGLLSRLLSPRFTPVVAAFFGGVSLVFSFYFLFCIAYRLHVLGYPSHLVFCAAAMLLICAACAKITWGFSSRYAGQAIPLLVLLSASFYRQSKFNVWRIAIGVSIGIVSITTYLLS